jgi:hypothetical protein
VLWGGPADGTEIGVPQDLFPSICVAMEPTIDWSAPEPDITRLMMQHRYAVYQLVRCFPGQQLRETAPLRDRHGRVVYRFAGTD